MKRDDLDNQMLSLLYDELEPACAEKLQAQIKKDPVRRLELEAWRKTRAQIHDLHEQGGEPELSEKVRADILRAARLSTAARRERTQFSPQALFAVFSGAIMVAIIGFALFYLEPPQEHSSSSAALEAEVVAQAPSSEKMHQEAPSPTRNPPTSAAQKVNTEQPKSPVMLSKSTPLFPASMGNLNDADEEAAFLVSKFEEEKSGSALSKEQRKMRLSDNATSRPKQGVKGDANSSPKETQQMASSRPAPKRSGKKNGSSAQKRSSNKSNMDPLLQNIPPSIGNVASLGNQSPADVYAQKGLPQTAYGEPYGLNPSPSSPLSLTNAMAQKQGWSNSHDLLARGETHRLAGEANLAIEVLTPLIEQKSLSKEEGRKALLNRGLARQQLSLHLEAIEDLRASLATTPPSPERRATELSLARSLIAIDSQEVAREHLSQLAKGDDSTAIQAQGELDKLLSIQGAGGKGDGNAAAYRSKRKKKARRSSPVPKKGKSSFDYSESSGGTHFNQSQ